MVGQAYSHILTPRAQQALQAGCEILIDGCFEGIEMIEKAEDVVGTIFGIHLPDRYLYRYTPLFLKQFTVCIITVAWKLAQPTHMPLSSLAEELAAWAIINQAKVHVEIMGEKDGEKIEESLEDFIDEYFEDLDFQYLFDDAYDGIDETPVGEVMGMTSLAFEDWFKPFSDEPSRIAHPYVVS